MKNIIYISIIAALLVTSIFFWQKSNRLSYRLALIQNRVEQVKRDIDERNKLLEEKKKEEALRLKEESLKADVNEVPVNARIAIVIDDWGYNTRNLKKAIELDAPITFAILPNLPYSRRVAVEAHDDGNEVILHLPMEPFEEIPLEKNTLMTDMSDKEIVKHLKRAISSIPHLKGISNHMGSKATEDERLMSIVLKEIKKEDLFYLDSVVTNHSICRRVSAKYRIKFAERSIFLDNVLNADYIKGQIMKLVSMAMSNGTAIGIGHDRQSTVEVLGEMIPELKKMNIAIVPVSEIVE